jgi:hypothetical protein
MLTVIWEQVLGPADVRALDALHARVIWIPDGAIEPLTDAALRYREIIGPPEADDPPHRSRGEHPGERRRSGGSGDAADRTASDAAEPAAGRAGRARAETAPGTAVEDGGGAEDSTDATPSIGSLADALEDALSATRDGAAAAPSTVDDRSRRGHHSTLL